MWDVKTYKIFPEDLERIHFVLVAHNPFQDWKILIVTLVYSPRESD